MERLTLQHSQNNRSEKNQVRVIWALQWGSAVTVTLMARNPGSTLLLLKGVGRSGQRHRSSGPLRLDHPAGPFWSSPVYSGGNGAYSIRIGTALVPVASHHIWMSLILGWAGWGDGVIASPLHPRTGFYFTYLPHRCHSNIIQGKLKKADF